jgi:hypothetical protein
MTRATSTRRRAPSTRRAAAKPIAPAHFKDQFITLLRETFEGPTPGEYSVYLDEGGGLFQLIAKLPAAAASRPSKPGMPTIAAHCAHLMYFNEILRQRIEGIAVRADWPGSWRTQKVNATEWKVLRAKLRASYEEVLAAATTRADWHDDAVSGSMAILVHSTYHLSAIRAAIRLTK